MQENWLSSDAHVLSSADLRDQLDDSLEELADGLDVLTILEKAYEKTMRAHVVLPMSDSSPIGDESGLTPHANLKQGVEMHSEHATETARGDMSVSSIDDEARRASVAHAASLYTQSAANSNVFLAKANFASNDMLSGPSTCSVSPPSSSTRPIVDASTSKISGAGLDAKQPFVSFTSSSGSVFENATTNQPSRAPIPLMEGSSTALLAILEPTPLPSSSSPLSLSHSSTRSPSPLSASDDPHAIGNFLPRSPVSINGRGGGSGLVLLNPQARRLLERGTPAYPVPPAVVSRSREVAARPVDINASDVKQKVDANENRAIGGTSGVVLRIAHLGDCMAMLVRGEEIVWRTDEMWWNVSSTAPLHLCCPKLTCVIHSSTLPFS